MKEKNDQLIKLRMKKNERIRGDYKEQKEEGKSIIVII